MNAHFKDLLRKYKDDKCTSEEAQLLLKYLKESESDLLAGHISEGLLDENFLMGDDVQPTLDQVFISITEKVQGQSRTTVKKMTRPWMYAAASIAILLAFAISFNKNWFEKGKQPLQFRVSTTNGETKEVILPDGSKIWLSDASGVAYTDDFDTANRRQIHLEGEAFFEVMANPDRPFDIVLPGDMRVTVLGTAFSVKAFEEEGEMKVKLLHGKVNVSTMGGELLLEQPGDQAVYQKSMAILTKNKVDTAYIGQWRNGILAFDGEPMREALNALERKYDVSIQVSDLKLQQRLITLSLKDETLEEVLKPLSFSHGFRYYYANDSTVVIQ